MMSRPATNEATLASMLRPRSRSGCPRRHRTSTAHSLNIAAISTRLAASGLLGALLLVDYAQGRSLYAAIASYHAYLEFPVLLAGLLALAPSRSHERAGGAAG